MMLFLIVLLPFAAALACAVLPNRARNTVAWIAGGTALAGCALLALTGPTIFGGGILRAAVPWFPRVAFGFRMDGLAWTFAGIIYAIGALVVLYAHYYMAREDPPARFCAFLLCFMGAMLGVVLADNLILLVVCWELTSLTSFLLIGFWTHRADARQGARMALAVTGAGGLCLLGGVIVLGHIVGSYSLDVVLAAGERIRAAPLYPVALVLILLGAFAKSAQFPFHFWLPHAMAAPTPVSAYLHSATMVKAGVFLLARLYPALGGTELWFYIVTGTGLVTLTLGAAFAIFQHDLKGLLAYSTISHLGLITLLFGLDSPLAVVAGIFHILNHAAFKASLFMSVGIIDHETGSRDMRQLNGMWHYMPITATLAMVAASAMAGVPLLNGFLSKEMFFAETLQLTTHPGFEVGVPVVAAIAATLAVAYSARFIHDVFFNGEPIGLTRTPHEPPRWLRIPVEILVVVCLAVGMLPAVTIGPVLDVAARSVLGDRMPAYSLALWHGFNLPLLMSALALVGGVVLYFGLQKTINLHTIVRMPMNGKQMYDRTLKVAVRSAQRIVGRSPGTSLPGGLVWIVIMAVAAMAWPLFRLGIGAPDVAMAPIGEIPVVIGVLIWVFGVGAAIAATVCYRQRFLALLLIGATGLAVSVGFVLLSAPDLALTQLLVEIATISLIMVVLHFLPQSSPPELHQLRQWRDGIIAVLAGIGITIVAHAVMTRPGAAIAPFYLDRALPEGGGTNVVNVIIVDFRGFDTLGEIVVLGMAGLIVFALLWNFRIPLAARTPEPTGPWNPVLMRTVARLLLPMATMVAIFLYLRGHNLPGGGFVAGLTMACALVALRIAGGGTRILDPRQLTYQSWVGGGLLAAGLTGVGSMLFGYPFLTTSFVHPVLPVIGEIPLASAMFFDLGVFMTVVGATLLTTIAPGLLPDGHIGEPPS